MSIAILFCGLMLSGCLENLSEEEYPTINLQPHIEFPMHSTYILVQAQSERLLVSDIVVNRGNCEVNDAKILLTNKIAEVNQERVNVLIEKGMTEEELAKNYIIKQEGIFVNNPRFYAWQEEARQMNLYHPFELKFGEQLRIVAFCRADSILEIVLKTDKGDLSYSFKD